MNINHPYFIIYLHETPHKKDTRIAIFIHIVEEGCIFVCLSATVQLEQFLNEIRNMSKLF